MPHAPIPSTSKLTRPTPKVIAARDAEESESDSDASGSEDNDHGDKGRVKRVKRSNKHA